MVYFAQTSSFDEWNMYYHFTPLIITLLLRNIHHLCPINGLDYHTQFAIPSTHWPLPMHHSDPYSRLVLNITLTQLSTTCFYTILLAAV